MGRSLLPSASASGASPPEALACKQDTQVPKNLGPPQSSSVMVSPLLMPCPASSPVPTKPLQTSKTWLAHAGIKHAEGDAGVAVAVGALVAAAVRLGPDAPTQDDDWLLLY
eukprot:3715539-Heterocapsa_arctica.AAC.1